MEEMIQEQSQERLRLLRETLGQLPLQLDDDMLQKLLLFYNLLAEKNKVMNLTAITEFPEVLEKHFLDSLALVRVADPTGKTVLDLGTGAGFPGIPLKIVYPDTDMVLADSLQKRLLFLEEVIGACDLKRIRTVHGRAEDLGKTKSEYREAFDLVVSRAVANLSSLSEYCLPFVKTGGCFVAYKSGNALEETENAQYAVNILGGKIENVDLFALPGTQIRRTFIVIRKMKSTPNRYPRKAGLPGKQPLEKPAKKT